MEVLLNSDHNLTSEEILWAASHLPDSKEQGTQMVVHRVFNHNANDVFEAIGCTHADAEKAAEVLSEACKNVAIKDDYNFSNGVEYVMQQSQTVNSIFPLLIVKALKEGLKEAKKARSMDALDEIRELLRKMKEKNEDEDDDI